MTTLIRRIAVGVLAAAAIAVTGAGAANAVEVAPMPGGHFAIVLDTNETSALLDRTVPAVTAGSYCIQARFSSPETFAYPLNSTDCGNRLLDCAGLMASRDHHDEVLAVEWTPNTGDFTCLTMVTGERAVDLIQQAMEVVHGGSGG